MTVIVSDLGESISGEVGGMLVESGEFDLFDDILDDSSVLFAVVFDDSERTRSNSVIFLTVSGRESVHNLQNHIINTTVETMAANGINTYMSIKIFTVVIF